VFGVYKDLIDKDLMPTQPLLGPEPWVVPKYQMFPQGKLVATTCGSWCYIFDWGRESKNPIPNVRRSSAPGPSRARNGGQYVLANLAAPWAVNAKSANVELAKKALMEIGSVKPRFPMPRDRQYSGQQGCGKERRVPETHRTRSHPCGCRKRRLPEAGRRLSAAVSPKASPARPKPCCARKPMPPAPRRSLSTTSSETLGDDAVK
jgi:hypothetical protein